MVLAFALELACLFKEPDAVVALHRLRTDAKVCNLPPARILKYRTQDVWPLGDDEVLKHHSVLTCGKIGNLKLGAIGGHAVRAKNTAIERCLLARRRPCIQ